MHLLESLPDELHLAWPEHATPVETLRCCEELLNLSHSTPLSRFLPYVEKLHATINEWEKIASREFTVRDLVEELVNLTVHWRQLELTTWASLFDRERAQCERNAASWWFMAYEAIIAATLTISNSPQELRL